MSSVAALRDYYGLEKRPVKVLDPGQMLGVGKNRVVTINNCRAKPDDRVNVKILENKNNIYLAEMA